MEASEEVTMILSVSRRTDIPNYYSEWFLIRIKDGYLYVKNPFNQHQVSDIKITPDVVDCIVFWTKNPSNMIELAQKLSNIARKYHIQMESCAEVLMRELIIPV